MAETSEPASLWNRPATRGTARWSGLVLFVGVGFLYLVSGLIAPSWAVGVLWVIWLTLMVAVIKVWRSRPWLVLATAVLAYLVWAGVMLAGEFILDWTA